jgi:photosystem II stability/assembly factor-like uncharacterized protein
MKKFALTLLSTCVWIFSFGQWTTYNTGTTDQLYSVFFPDSNTGYATGWNGAMVKTSDAGANWTVLSSGTSQALLSVYFTSATTGYAVGNGGLILKTTNGGITWSSQTAGSNNLTSVRFIDTNNGYAVGAAGTVLFTPDGGVTWPTQSSTTTYQLNSVFFLNNINGYAAGHYGTIIHYDGTSWSSLTTGTSDHLYSIFFVDSNIGYAAGLNGTIIKTSDGGATWESLSSGTSLQLSSIYFTDANTGYVLGLNGLILKTTDGGITWSNSVSGSSNNLWSVYFTDAATGYVADGNGNILKTTTAGNCPITLNVNVSSTDLTCYYSYNGSATATVTGGDGSYIYSWTGGGTSSEITGLTAGGYTVNVTDGNGCTGSNSVTLTQPDPLTITPSVPATICPGSSTVISAAVAGGTSPYTIDWYQDGNNISNLSSVTVSPTGSTGYMVTVSDMNGCFGTASTSISMLPATSITGSITYSGGPLTSGVNTVALYEYLPFATAFNAIQTTTLDLSGDFTFSNVNFGSYIVKVFADTSLYPSLIPTYFDGQYLWDNAVVINHTCDSNSVVNFEMLEAPVLSGTGTISGNIIETDGFNRIPGDPIPGVDVKLGRNPGGQLIANTQTDATGEYSFDNVPVNFPGESYTIYVDIPGLERDSSYTVVVTSSNLNFPNLNYFADSTTVSPNLSGATGVYGHVSYSGGPVSSGNNVVSLYQYLPFPSSFDAVQTTTLDASGNYYFPSVSIGDYIVKVFNDETTYPNLIPTYYYGEYLWDYSMVLSHNWVNDDTANISMLEVPAISGPGSISGTIVETTGFRSPGDAISGANVILGIQPSGQLIGSTLTNVNGNYSFNNLPINNPGENYILYVDIPGLVRDSTYTITITAGITDFPNLNYIAGATTVTPDLITLGINAGSTKENQFAVYPNPTTGIINIKTENTNKIFHLTDLSGRMIYALKENSFQNGSVIHIDLKALGVSSGTYLLDFTGSEMKYKIIFIQD